MASLSNLLNPDYSRAQENSHHNDESDGPSDAFTESVPEEGSSSYYTRDHTVDHEIHPDCPNTLDCLQDTDDRPPHTLPVILRCAILGSPKQRLTIREIYAAMENKYPYYKTAGPTWKQSVRHHLSLNRLFERQARPVTDPGFGSYWVVNLEAPPGTKRPRKRGRPKGPGGAPQPARKRGRPRKDDLEISKCMTSVKEWGTSGANPSWPGEEEKEGESEVRENTEAVPLTDDEDSAMEDNVVHPFDRPMLRTVQYLEPLEADSSPVASLGALEPCDDPFEQIEQMRKEIIELRKKTSEATCLSQRMSDQLAHAQADAWRAKSALRTAENKLKQECKRRQDAERLAEEELLRRRLLEDSLRELRSQKRNSNPLPSPSKP
ncbi:forkhead box protein [Pleurotus pulmonarius]|nr:forkhead box protein [Pleurotus pulmonarius]KAF4606358.1 forkhead box protein [Pleurotus pulmonarius]